MSVFYDVLMEKSAQRQEREEQRRGTWKRNLGIGLGAAALAGGILGRKKLKGLFGSATENAPTPSKGVVGDGVPDTPEELFDLHFNTLTETTYLNPKEGPAGRLFVKRDIPIDHSNADYADLFKRPNAHHFGHGVDSPYVTASGGAHPHAPRSDYFSEVAPDIENMSNEQLQALRTTMGDRAPMPTDKAYQAFTSHTLHNLTREQIEQLAGIKSLTVLKKRIAQMREANERVRMTQHPMRYEHINDTGRVSGTNVEPVAQYAGAV
jgi:hypothetical protein